MKHPSTLAFYGAIMIIIVQISRSFLYDLFGFFSQILNYFLMLIDLFGMALIANFFYRLHLQHKNDPQKPQNEFKE